jgi:hypothetical protein
MTVASTGRRRESSGRVIGNRWHEAYFATGLEAKVEDLTVKLKTNPVGFALA